MEIDTSTFWVFVFVAALVVHLAGRTPQSRSWILLAFSVAYACTWGAPTIVVLVLLGVATLVWTRVIAASPTTRRKTWLALGIVTVTAPLVLLKLWMSDAGALLVQGAGAPLPVVGLSYVTFSCISQLVETADRPADAARITLRDTLTSLLYFPKLLSGPITRAHEMLPQLQRVPRVTEPLLRYGMFLVVVGLTKKHIGDLLSAMVLRGFDESRHLTTIEAWVVCIAFAAQLYADFSGYTDVARGVGALLGLELPHNFNLPFLARSPVDFWSRWHMSLSFWLRDHLFMPIAVHSRWLAPAVAVFVTMFLGGLWHGNSFKFALWGIYHAVVITSTYALGLAAKRAFPSLAESRLTLPFRIAGTFFAMLVGMVIFRAATMTGAMQILGSLFNGGPGVSHRTVVSMPFVLAALVLPHLVDAGVQKWEPSATVAPRRFRPVRYWAALAACALFMILSAGAEAGAPLYSKF